MWTLNEHEVGHTCISSLNFKIQMFMWVMGHIFPTEKFVHITDNYFIRKQLHGLTTKFINNLPIVNMFNGP